jgi:TM2 domain-containing membrane protein YozV
MMKNSMKGALLSGLVFPGVGQVALRYYGRGIAFILTVSVFLLVLVVKAVQQAFTTLEKIEAEGGIISMNTITNAVTQASTASDDLTSKLLLFSLIVCWIFGVIDAYRVGKRKDTDEDRIIHPLSE